MNRFNKADYTKKKIKDTLLEFMKIKSIDRIKVVDISNELNINRGTFYSYYDSIYDPLQEIEDDFFEGFRKINKDFVKYPLDNKYFYIPHPKIVETLEYMHSHSYVTKILFGPYGDLTFQNKCNKLISDFFFQKAVNEHLVSEEDTLMEAFLIGGQKAITVEWINNDMKLDNEKFAILIYRLMFGLFKSSYNESKAK